MCLSGELHAEAWTAVWLRSDLVSMHCCLGSAAQIRVTFRHWELKVPKYHLAARAQSQDLVLGYWHCARILGTLLDLVPSVSIAYAVADLEQKSEGAQEEEKAAGQATK